MREEHERKHSWDGRWPMTEMDDAVQLVQRLRELMMEAAGGTPTFDIHVAHPNRTRRTDRPEEFAEAAPHLPLETLQRLAIHAEHHGTQGDDLRANLDCDRGLERYTLLTVRGTKVTAVNGVASQMQEMIDERLAAVEEAEAAAHSRQAQAERETVRPAGARPPASQPRWYQNPWIVATVGGVFATVVGGVILALLL